MFKRLMLLAAVIAGVAGSGQVVHAASVNFRVAPEIPKNQITKNLGYFDLLVTPGSTQALAIRIQNTASGSHRYLVQTNRAGTGQDGNTNYSEHGQTPTKSLAVNIESLMPKPHTYTVDPHTTRTIKLRLTAPKTAWAGILLGGIDVTQIDYGANKASGAATSTRPAYTIGLQIQATKQLQAYTPQLQFNGPKIKTTSSGTTVSALIENTAPVLQTGLRVSAKVTAAASNKTVLTKTISSIKMAPNSEMAFPLAQTPANLKPGKYHLTLKAKNGDQSWHFADEFTVDQTVMKTKTTAKQVVKSSPLPPWVSGILVVIASGLIYSIWYLLRRRQKS